MIMRKKKTKDGSFSADEHPIHIPPVDASWRLMRQKLDAQMPVPRRAFHYRWVSFAGVATAAAAGLIIWMNTHKTQKAIVRETDKTMVPATVTKNAPAGRKEVYDPVAYSRDSMNSVGGRGSAAGGGANASGVGGAGVSARDAGVGTRDAGVSAEVTKKPGGSTEKNVGTRKDLATKNNGAMRSGAAAGHDIATGVSGIVRPGVGTGRNMTVGNGVRPRRGVTAGNGAGVKRGAGDPQGKVAGGSRGQVTGSPGGQEGGAETQEHRAEAMKDNDAWKSWKVSMPKRSDPGGLQAAHRLPDSVLRKMRFSRSALVAGKSIPEKEGLFLTAGLYVGKNFPTGGQEPAPYNVSGKSNLLSDYLPGPYIQLHVNSRLSLQASIQINSPQYTRSQKIDSAGGDTSKIPGWQNYLEFRRVTLKKLYYTDFSLLLYYRIYGGLQLGAGLQLSRLRGGVAQQDLILHPSNGLGADTLYRTETISLKTNGDAYQKVAKDDWRLLLEARYNWRRFGLAVRYQQALRPFTPVLVGGVTGKDKNTAIGVYLFYDIFARRSTSP